MTNLRGTRARKLRGLVAKIFEQMSKVGHSLSIFDWNILHNDHLLPAEGASRAHDMVVGIRMSLEAVGDLIQDETYSDAVKVWNDGLDFEEEISKCYTHHCHDDFCFYPDDCLEYIKTDGKILNMLRWRMNKLRELLESLQSF